MTAAISSVSIACPSQPRTSLTSTRPDNHEPNELGFPPRGKTRAPHAGRRGRREPGHPGRGGLLVLFLVFLAGFGGEPGRDFQREPDQAQGSSADYHLLTVLTKAGLAVHDVTLTYLQPAEGLAALSSGHVDAWDIWSPFVEQAEVQEGARALVKARRHDPDLRLVPARLRLRARAGGGRRA